MALSLSGKRYDKVSRESSVHSMISISSPFIESFRLMHASRKSERGPFSHAVMSVAKKHAGGFGTRRASKLYGFRASGAWATRPHVLGYILLPRRGNSRGHRRTVGRKYTKTERKVFGILSWACGRL